MMVDSRPVRTQATRRSSLATRPPLPAPCPFTAAMSLQVPTAEATGLVLEVLGCRGSIGVSGPRFQEMGGGTTALRVCTDEGDLHIDAGSGLTRLLADGPALPSRRRAFFLTHGHWDHVCGLPHFPPLYNPAEEIELLGVPRHGHSPASLLRDLCRPPLFPVDPTTLQGADLRDSPLEPEGSTTRFGLTLSWCEVPHPGGASALSIEGGGERVVIVPDCELAAAPTDALRQLAHGATHLLLDAHFTAAELPRYRGWGHSADEEVADFAREAEVGTLWLFHHAPWRTDEDVRGMVERARSRFPRTRAARCGLRIPFGSREP